VACLVTTKQFKTKVKKRLKNYMTDHKGKCKSPTLDDGEIDIIAEEIAHFVRSEVNTLREEIWKSQDPLQVG